MDLLDLTAAELSQKCLTSFDRCLASSSHADKDQPRAEEGAAISLDERLEYKLADFNLWIDGIGALASSRASLDWRLNERPIDLSLVKGNLVMLYQSLQDYADLQEKHQSIHEAFLDIESALRSLASLALAVRRTGKRSRLHKADRLFSEEEHIELKRHLECVVVLRPEERGQGSHRFKQKVEALTPVQQRLVVANLRRRNRFLQARRHSTGLKRRNPILQPIPEGAVNDTHQTIASLDLELPNPAQPAVQHLLKKSDAPTISGTSASVPESKLRYSDPAFNKPETSAARTEVTRITATAHYPRPQLPDSSQKLFQCPCCYQTLPVEDVKTNARWRKHLGEDICPYTCVVEDCPAPHIYYSTRTALEQHIRQDHPPTWQCPLCGDGSKFTTMTNMMEHFTVLHPDAAEGSDISTLISLSAQRKTGIDACPLCDVAGIVDSPELIDHVLEHVHDFSLRSLPWSKSSHVSQGGEVGTFDPGHSNSSPVIQWLGDLPKEDGGMKLQLCQFDHNRLLNLEIQTPSVHDDDLPVEICFADEHGDESAAAETDVSHPTQGTTLSSSIEETTPRLSPIEETPDDEGERTSPDVFNAGDTGATPEEVPESAETPKARKPDADLQPPTYRAARYLFNLLKDSSGKLSEETFATFAKRQRSREQQKRPDLATTDDFERVHRTWIDSGTSVLGPLPPKNLSKPLTDYFISSSYQTYRVGNQLTARASPEAYEHILMQGCRHVEIPVWDGDESAQPVPAEPVVIHGWSSMQPCGFREVCATIASSAFANNDLPVIVNIQVHAKTEQQELMVKIMKEEWGELLLDQPLEGCDPRFRVPTLGDLRRRILVMVSVEEENEKVSLIRDDPSSDSETQGGLGISKESKRGVVVCEALGQLAVYTRSVKYLSLDDPAAKNPSHVFSFDESKLLELNRADQAGVFAHNKNYFMHSFPSAQRKDTSNADPVIFWNFGVQMMSMDWQWFDEGMMLHHGMFADEDGWVIKPPQYRGEDKRDLDGSSMTQMQLEVIVYAGFDIPDYSQDEEGSSSSKRMLRPHVITQALSTDGDGDEDDGWHRYRHEAETNESNQLGFGAEGSKCLLPVRYRQPKFSFLIFKVVNDPRSDVHPIVLGWACLRLDRLRNGYRLVELSDAQGRKTSGVLLVKMTGKLSG